MKKHFKKRNIRTLIKAGVLALTLTGGAIVGTLIKANNDKTPFEQREPLKKGKTGIFLIDMQDKFLGRIDTREQEREIPNQIKVLEYAQENNLPIYVLEYEGKGETTARLKRQLSNGEYETITKPDDNGFLGTDLDALLTDDEIENIVLMGINASFCVKRTATGAKDAGYRIITSPEVISDPIRDDCREESLEWYYSEGYVSESVSDLIDCLEEYAVGIQN